MGKITYFVAASLDGFIADAEGGVDWLPDGEADDQRYDNFYAGVQALAMGRHTYDQVLGFGEWPYPGKTAYVFTHSPPPDGPEGVRFFQGSAEEFVSNVAAQHSGAVWLVGGANLANQFRQGGLIDEYLVFVIPIILGEGVALFGGPGPHTALELVTTESYPDGLVKLHYRRPGAP